MKQRLPSLGALADQILAEVATEQRTKEAAAAPIKATPVGATELSQLLNKLAAELRTNPESISYEDLTQFLKGLTP